MSKQAKTLNERELQRLLDFVKTTKSATRNRAILLLLLLVLLLVLLVLLSQEAEYQI